MITQAPAAITLRATESCLHLEGLQRAETNSSEKGKSQLPRWGNLELIHFPQPRGQASAPLCSQAQTPQLRAQSQHSREHRFALK